jgi:hypothetical protein
MALGEVKGFSVLKKLVLFDGGMKHIEMSGGVLGLKRELHPQVVR